MTDGRKKWNLEFLDSGMEISYWKSIVAERKSYIVKVMVILHVALIFNNYNAIDQLTMAPGNRTTNFLLYYLSTVFMCHAGIILVYFTVYLESTRITFIFPFAISLVRLFDTIVTSYIYQYRRTQYWIILMFLLYCSFTGSWKRKMVIAPLLMCADYVMYYCTMDYIYWNMNPNIVALQYFLTDIPMFIVIASVGYRLEKMDRERFVARMEAYRLEDSITKRNRSAAALLENIMPSGIIQKLVGVLRQSLKTGEVFSTLAKENCMEFHENATIVFFRVTKHRQRTLFDEIGVTDSIISCTRAFRELDEVVENLGFTKVKSVMNRYMIFSNSADVVEAMNLCKNLRTVLISMEYSVKIGVIAGARIASGILGHRRLQWDVISKDVNFAYHLMETCEDNEIRFPSSMVKELLSRDAQVARSCGVIELKGIGIKEVSLIPHSGGRERVRNSLLSPRKTSILKESLKFSAKKYENLYEICSKDWSIESKFVNPEVENDFHSDASSFWRFINFSSVVLGLASSFTAMLLFLVLGTNPSLVLSFYLPILTIFGYFVIFRREWLFNDRLCTLFFEYPQCLFVYWFYFVHGGNPLLVAETSYLLLSILLSIMITSEPILYKLLIVLPGVLAPVFVATGKFKSIPIGEPPCFLLILILTHMNFNEMRRYFRMKQITLEKLKFVEAMESLLNDLVGCMLPAELLRDRMDEIKSFFLKISGGEMLLKNDPVLETFECASIICVDFVNFTEYNSPGYEDDTFQTWNSFYSRFDKVCSTFEDVIPISTVGDFYVCISLHCEGDADLKPLRVALAFQEEIELDTDSRLNARVGIACGTVTGGILLSRSRSVYEVWGDVMVRAERLEKEGSPGFIRMTRKQAIAVGLKPDISDDDNESCGVNFQWSDIRALVG